MEDYNSAPSRGFIWGVAIATLVVVAVVAFIFKAVTPAGPMVSVPEQSAAAPVATTAQTTTASTGEATGSAPAETGIEGSTPENSQASGAQTDTPGPDRADESGTAQAAASEETQMVQVAFTGDTGAALYVQACQSCHMPEGRGAEGAGIYPALANNTRATSTAYVTSLILNGNGGMPSFGHYLDDQQIAMIVNYVRGDLNGQDGNVQPQEIKELRPANPDYLLFGEGAG